MAKIKCGLEIERKFLVSARNLPLSNKLADENAGYYSGGDFQIIQNYIPNGETKLRLRYQHHQDSDDQGCSSEISHFLTAKSGQGLERQEVEIRIAKDIYNALLPKSKAMLSKRRLIFLYRGHKIEIDMFEVSLRGLIIAEVEFETVEAAQAFVPPAWFGKEVTEDARYCNENLAQHGRPQDDNTK